MATADIILERHRTRRRLAIWRVVAIVAILVAIIAMLPGRLGLTGAHVARIDITGVITEDERREAVIADLADDDNVKALIVHIDSPGGTIAASESLYQAVRKVAGAKPVVAVMAEYAASGGYITAIAADHIVARGNTLTGSIGVVMQAPNISELLENLGVEVSVLKSGPLKAEPNMVSPVTPEALEAQQSIIADTFAWFRGLVETRRGIEGSALDRITDGRAFTGRQALENGLIDTLGGPGTARDWLADTHEIDPDLPVKSYSWSDSQIGWPLGSGEDAALLLREFARIASPTPRLYAIIR